MAEEHYLKEAPYVVMDAGKKGYGAQCICGWRSVLYDTEAELKEVIKEHFTNPGPPPKKKRWWQKKDYDYQDRRRN